MGSDMAKGLPQAGIGRHCHECLSLKTQTDLQKKDLDVDSGEGEPCRPGIDSEEVDLPAYEVADARLRNAHQLGGLALGELTLLDELLHLDHEHGTDPKMLGLFHAKAKIGEHVPAGGSDLHEHGMNAP